MKITRITRTTEGGDYEATLALTQEQTEFLIQFAIGFLVQQGTLSFFDIPEKDYTAGKGAESDAPAAPAEATPDQMTGFLESLDPAKLPQS